MLEKIQNKCACFTIFCHCSEGRNLISVHTRKELSADEYRKIRLAAKEHSQSTKCLHVVEAAAEFVEYALAAFVDNIHVIETISEIEISMGGLACVLGFVSLARCIARIQVLQNEIEILQAFVTALLQGQDGNSENLSSFLAGQHIADDQINKITESVNQIQQTIKGEGQAESPAQNSDDALSNEITACEKLLLRKRMDVARLILETGEAIASITIGALIIAGIGVAPYALLGLILADRVMRLLFSIYKLYAAYDEKWQIEKQIMAATNTNKNEWKKLSPEYRRQKAKACNIYLAEEKLAKCHERINGRWYKLIRYVVETAATAATLGIPFVFPGSKTVIETTTYAATGIVGFCKLGWAGYQWQRNSKKQAALAQDENQVRYASVQSAVR